MIWAGVDVSQRRRRIKACTVGTRVGSVILVLLVKVISYLDRMQNALAYTDLKTHIYILVLKVDDFIY